MGISMDISTDISMDILMDIHEKICGYGCGYGWEISYPRQACAPLPQCATDCEVRFVAQHARAFRMCHYVSVSLWHLSAKGVWVAELPNTSRVVHSCIFDGLAMSGLAFSIAPFELRHRYITVSVWRTSSATPLFPVKSRRAIAQLV